MNKTQLKLEEKLQQLIESDASLVNSIDAATILGYKPNIRRV